MRNREDGLQKIVTRLKEPVKRLQKLTKVIKLEFEVVNIIAVSINTIVACLNGSKSDTSNISSSFPETVD